MIYLDYAASTPLDSRVRDAMLPCLEEQWGNPSSPHTKGRDARGAIDESRQHMAQNLGCKAQEILFTGSGSEANALAIRGICTNPGRIISQPTEHACVRETLLALEKEGHEVVHLPVDDNGVIDLDALKKEIEGGADFVSIQWINSELGTIQPVDQIASLCKEHAIPYHCDGMQGIGILPLPNPLPDLFTMAAHKFYGPKGIGALIASDGINLQPIVRGGGQEFGMRAGTENTPGIVGMSTALQIAIDEQETHLAHLTKLRAHLLGHLPTEIANTKIQDVNAYAPSIVNLHVPGTSGETTVIQLDLAGICTSTGSACTTGASEPSHVLKAIGVSDEQAKEHVRISFGRQTTLEEVDAFIDAVKN